MKTLKIACIGNYVPRQCGIATFTRDLVEAMAKNTSEKVLRAEAYVVAMNDLNQTYEYPEAVAFTIRQEHQRDYLKAVKYINYSEADVCLLQHEFGIFGGDDGVYILSLIQRLRIPLVVTFHTVLEKPSYNQKVIVQKIAKKADKVVVMSNLAIDFLTGIYRVPKKKIRLIEHGVPDFSYMQRKEYKKLMKLEDRKSLLTFGLLSKDKGIETVIHALPRVLEKYPDILYIVLGKTHPAVLRVSGEEYRNYLKRLVEKYRIRDHVYFYDRYVGNEELFGYLNAADVYITPYLNKAQITSGTLVYAIGAGAAVVSTPYWHARELLAEGRGKLYNFGDSEALAEILIQLFDNPAQLKELREKAYLSGCRTLWPEIGTRYLELLSAATPAEVREDPKDEAIINPLVLPLFKLDHVLRLTDKTGILQHATFGIPDFKEGYCLDDNARALLMAVMAYRQKKNEQALDLIPIYLSYINYMQNDDGTFKNFLTYNRQFTEEVGSGDSFGRAIWALGYLMRFPPKDAYCQMANAVFAKAYPHFEKLTALRDSANTIIGICHYLHRYPTDEGMKKVMLQMTEKIVNRYKQGRSGDWHWFEPKVSYDNAIIPLALFHSVEMTGEEDTLQVAKESTEFLEKLCFKNGYLSLVGNEHWHQKGGEQSRFAQQPIDAMAMVQLAYQAAVVTKDPRYIQSMSRSFMWFLGENELGIPLYDFETDGCFDGLERHGVNKNQGTESTLAYLISHLTVLLAHE
jgi:glycosyltransferase involved in cell wall biosynthesis